MKYDVIAIGNAVMDVIAPVDEYFLSEMAIQKGIMQLVELERAEMLYHAMGNTGKSPAGPLPTRWPAAATLA